MTATIIVEDGTIVTSSNSYVSTTTLNTFALNRGYTILGTKEDLLIKAMDYIEALNFKGAKRTSTQSLQWPRVDVFIDGYYFNSDEIPQALKDGLCHCALAIDADNDPLQDTPRKVVRQSVGEVSIEYSAGSSSVVINKKIMNVLRKLLVSGGNTLNVSKG